MANLNRVYLIGNLTRDPEVRYTPSGRAVGDLRLAVNRTYTTQDGEKHDETCFVSIVVWGRQAETCGQYLSKGSPLLAEGRLQYEEWERDGQKHNRLRVVAERVQFLGSPRNAESTNGGQSRPNVSKDPEPRREAPPVEDVEDDDNLPF